MRFSQNNQSSTTPPETLVPSSNNEPETRVSKSKKSAYTKLTTFRRSGKLTLKYENFFFTPQIYQILKSKQGKVFYLFKQVPLNLKIALLNIKEKPLEFILCISLHQWIPSWLRIFKMLYRYLFKETEHLTDLHLHKRTDPIYNFFWEIRNLHQT